MINEYYPNASASVALDTERINKKMEAGIKFLWNGDVLNNMVRGSIVWSVVDLPIEAEIPPTENPGWVALRNVDSRHIKVATGESENYLFYRGVAHLEAMLQTRSSSAEVTLLSPSRLHWLPKPTSTIPETWIVEVPENGTAAFRIIENIAIHKNTPSNPIRSLPSFTHDEFVSENLADLEQSMKDALVVEGLFQKEAAAMLATWNKSYSKGTGSLILYIVQSEWIEYLSARKYFGAPRPFEGIHRTYRFDGLITRNAINPG